MVREELAHYVGQRTKATAIVDKKLYDTHHLKNKKRLKVRFRNVKVFNLTLDYIWMMLPMRYEDEINALYGQRVEFKAEVVRYDYRPKLKGGLLKQGFSRRNYGLKNVSRFTRINNERNGVV